MTERYRILDHPADGKFRAFGETVEEAFGNAALAMASLMWNWEKIAPRLEYSVEIRGRDLKQLLYKFLEEILYLLDTKRFLLGAIEGLRIESGEEFVLRAGLRGDAYSDRVEIFGDVKAVTYNEMKIESCACGPWVIQVVVDM
jgi:SHS2 domain-containing protein